MTALITGASSGIGQNIALELAEKGFDLILVARNTKGMELVKSKVGVSCRTVSCDLSEKENCTRLCSWLVTEDIDVVVNCAGVGVFGKFSETDLQDEINMINININALHIITKFFVKKFLKEGRGRILNVSSAAAYAPGPLFSGYYATKAYVLRLTRAIACEIKGSGVYIGALCPGTVKTPFNKRAGVGEVSAMSAEYVAKCAVKGMLKGKAVIIPGAGYKLAVFFSKLIPDGILAKITYKFQKNKLNG